MTERDLARIFWVGFLLVLSCAAPTLADAPPSRYTSANGTVYDTRTRLTWQLTLDAGTYTQSSAVTYCAGLTLAGLSWRLPSVEELETLVDDTRVNPSIDTTAFPGTPSVGFWTSSLCAGLVGDAWYTFFNNGWSLNAGVTNSLRVRCVR
jgi:hypothetical protein